MTELSREDIKQPVVELTGRMGSGKSLAASVLREMGRNVVDADAVSKQIVLPGAPAFEDIIARFPVETENGIDRDKLRELTFGVQDQDAIAELEAITHPRIKDETIRQLAEADGPYVVHERPALRVLSSIRPDHVLSIDQPDARLERRRIIERDRKKKEQQRIKAPTISPVEVDNMLLRQMSRDELAKRADYVIVNNSSRDNLEVKVRDWDTEYISKLR